MNQETTAQKNRKFVVKPATGKLGILMPGMGAVATTFVAGVFAARKGIAKPFGSLTQMGTIRIGKRTENQSPLIKDYISITPLESIEFGGWDIFSDSMYEAAKKADVLSSEHLEALKTELHAIKPMAAAFSEKYIKNIQGPNIKKGTLWEIAQAIRNDIVTFKKEKGCERLVMVWCGSTEAFCKP